jgi:predicted ester cyclase
MPHDPLTSTAAATNTDIVLGLVEALNAADFDTLRAGYAGEVWERFPDATVHGPDAIVEYFRAVHAAFPDLRIEVLDTAEEGESVFMRSQISGTHTGAPFAGLQPTGRPVRIDAIDHFTIRDGRMASNFVVFDQLELGRQLGLLPPDGSAPDRALKTAFNAVTALRARVKR